MMKNSNKKPSIYELQKYTIRCNDYMVCKRCYYKDKFPNSWIL